MKAKDLKLGDLVYRAEINSIKVVRVTGLKMVAGDVHVSLSSYITECAVKPDAEAIITTSYGARYYFNLKAAQLRQLRLRNDEIEARQADLEKAAQLYAETLAKYKDVPPTEPIEV